MVRKGEFWLKGFRQKQITDFISLINHIIVRQITGIILANLDFRYIENVSTDFDSSGPLLKETS